ncbi:hypothetical protein QUF80_22635 [Desulfococcaceae bacterium HSG8]|nr:hypothetical protein [Desulfococcaceae bacterium HSG8]
MLPFKQWTLVNLDETFDLKQVRDCCCLQNWLDGQAEISDLEKQILMIFREKLRLNVDDWNETELSQNFIGPVFALTDFTTDKFNHFAERLFSGTVDGIEMGGKPDGMIASGYREPRKPYFCFQEYKREKDSEGDPAAQALAAMLVAQEINEHKIPIYGSYVRGRLWFFMVLKGRAYSISDAYVATRDDVFDLFRILRHLKQMLLSADN